MMGGGDVTAILIGLLAGNLAAVLVPRINLGLLWNSIMGVVGALAVQYAPTTITQMMPAHWAVSLGLQGVAAFLLTLVAGALNEMRFRS